MKALRKIFEAITTPFISVAVMIDESRRINEDGSWDKYNERKNNRERKRAERREKGGKR